MPRIKKKQVQPVAVIEPTPEALARGTFGRLQLAYRRIPVIDTLYDGGKLSTRQHRALGRYRDIAIAEEKSPVRDSLDRVRQGRYSNPVGAGGTHFHTAYELQRLEMALGQLHPIARAIAVEDLTPSQWAMQQSGATERRREGKGGGKAVTWFEPRRTALKLAMLEIRYAGDALAAAIG